MIDEKGLEAAGRKVARMLNERDDTGLHIAEAALSAYLAHLAEAGRVIVPVEPTEAMTWEGAGEMAIGRDTAGANDVYRAMIAARPQNEGE